MTLRNDTKTFHWISQRWGKTTFKFRPKSFPMDEDVIVIVYFSDNIIDSLSFPKYLDYRFLKIYNNNILTSGDIFNSAVDLIKEFKNGFSHRLTAVRFLLKRDELKGQLESGWQPMKIKANAFFVMNE